MDTAIRPATLADLETFVAQRAAMFRDMDYGDEAGLARMAPEFRALLRTWLTTGQARGWVAEVAGQDNSDLVPVRFNGGGEPKEKLWRQ